MLIALITGARIGEVLGLRWAECADGFLASWKTKNRKVRRVEITPSLNPVLAQLLRTSPWVITNQQPQKGYTVNGARHIFDRRWQGRTRERRDAPHPAAHGTEPDDRGGLRRRTELDADAGPLDAPYGSPEATGARDLRRRPTWAEYRLYDRSRSGCRGLV